MHARKKGKSGSTRPYRTKSPDWVPLSNDEIKKKIVELKDQGHSTSVMGVILRDNYGVPSVKLATGISIKSHLEEAGVKFDIPEDLVNLMVKAVNLDNHLKVNRKDLHNKRSLNLVEAKIRRLTRYYHGDKKLPEGWKYTMKTAKLLVG